VRPAEGKILEGYWLCVKLEGRAITRVQLKSIPSPSSLNLEQAERPAEMEKETMCHRGGTFQPTGSTKRKH